MKYLLTILFFFTCSFAYSQKTYFFDAVTGNDANTSVQATNQATPWKTLTKLNSFFSSLVAGDIVRFNRGQTFLGSITATKSGNVGTPITLADYGTGARPIIEGSYTVPSWTSIGSNLYTATIPAALSTVGTVTFDGVFQPMGRLPKQSAGYYNATAVGGAGNTITSTGTSVNNPNTFVGAPSCVGGQVVWRALHFSIWIGTITAQSATVVSYTPLPSTSGGATENPQIGYGFFLQNHPSTCTTLGEWAYNGTTHVLTVNFGAGGPGGHTVKVSAVQKTINVEAFSNISFSNLQIGFGNTYNFSLNGSQNINISNCTVFGGGVYSIFANGASPGLTVSNSLFDRANSVAINYSSGSTTTTLTSDTITNTAMISGMGGVGEGQYMGVQNIKGTMTHCRVTSTGYMAIIYQAPAQILNNFVDTFCVVKDDGGGIYNGPPSQSGSLVDHNIVLDGIGLPQGTPDPQFRAEGLYSDDGASNVTWTNNTVAHMGDACAFNHASFNVNMVGNTFFDSKDAIIRYFNDLSPGTSNVTQTNNIFFAANASNWCLRQSSGAASASTYFGAAASVNNNFWCRPIAETQVFNTASGSFTLPTWKTFTGKEAGSIVTPWSITNTNQLLFKYNATNSPVTFPLVGNYIDVRSVTYPSSITLQPFTSAILKSNGSTPPLLSATSSALVNPLNCSGNSTVATVNATGGTPPYQFKIGSGSFQSGNTFPGLVAGTYIFTVQDAALTQVTTTLTITSPTAITISQTSGTITINGNTTSTVVTAGGGTPSYQYRLDGSALQNSATFTGVGAGPHTITVQDSHACTNTLAYTLTQPAAISLSLAATTNPLLCFGNLTTLTATTTGGTTPYSYTINGGSPQSSNVFPNLGAGTYQVTVTDFAGAVTSKTLVITQPAQITITETHTAIAVNGGSSTVTFTATNGVGTKTYSINGGTPQTSNVFTLLAGTYTVTVKDANNCQNTFTFTILQPSSLLVSASITTAIPCNGGVGSITGSASGGTLAYDYQLNGGTRQSSPIFNNLSTGTYTLTVHDGGGAVVSASPLTLTQPAPIIINVNAGPSAPATVTVTITSGGIAPFTYKLDSGTPQGTGTFLNVTSGNHTVLVTDSHGCTTSQIFNIGSSLSLTLSVGAIACNGGFTNATVIPAGGTLPYSYSWSTGGIQSTIVNVPSATYTIRVTDNAGHEKDTTFVITQPPTVTISLAIGTIVVNGGTAAVTVTAGGGSGSGYTYNLDSTSYGGSNSFPTVSAGNHFILVKDGNGCVKRQDFSMSQPGRLIITISRGAAINCPGGTQTITVGSTGGSGTVVGTGAFPTLAGTVTFSIHDQFSTADTQILITEPTPLTLSVAFTAILISGNTSTVTGTGGGGTPSLQYSLDGGSYQGSPIFAGVLAGVHFMIVKDNNACTLRNDFSISQPDPLQVAISIGTNPLLCNGNTTTVTITPSKGTPPYTITGGSPQTLGAGTYHAHVVDQFGATFDSIFQITAPSLIVLLSTVPQGTIATYGGTVDVLIQNSGGTPINDSLYQYSLDGGSFVTSDSAFSYILPAVTGGNHTIGIKDANGCTKQFPFVVPQPSPPAQFMNRSKRQKHVYRNG